MKKLIFILLLLGLTFQVYAQISEQLPEVVISVNYKYLDAVTGEDIAKPVEMLQKEVALYDLKNSELYSDEYSDYYVTFYIPEGKILAAYDKDGNLTRTIEKFKNVKLPNHIAKSIAERFPGWNVEKDIYKLSYHHKKGVINQEYKVRLQNGDKTLKVKVDADGNFM